MALISRNTACLDIYLDKSTQILLLMSRFKSVSFLLNFINAEPLQESCKMKKSKELIIDIDFIEKSISDVLTLKSYAHIDQTT